MTTDTPPPRRNWHFTRWLVVFIVAVFGWSGWRAYAFRSALSQAKALGWEVMSNDPSKEDQKNRDLDAEKETGKYGVTKLTIPTSEAFEQHLAIVHRLNPMALHIENAATLRDLSALKAFTRLQELTLNRCTGLNDVEALKNLTALQALQLGSCPGLTNLDALKSLSNLQELYLFNCSGLTNLDALKNLPELEQIYLLKCTGLKNVDALKTLPSLQWVRISGCTGLPEETIAALEAALPNVAFSVP